jgi:hypothetical protein
MSESKLSQVQALLITLKEQGVAQARVTVEDITVEAVFDDSSFVLDPDDDDDSEKWS